MNGGKTGNTDGHAIQYYMVSEKLDVAKPKDLMSFLIHKGFFTKDNKEGKLLRDVLRSLDESSELYLLPQVRVERKEKNVYWFFDRLQF